MHYFPLSIDLTGKQVFLVGNGTQIRSKAEKLAPFGAVLIRADTFTPADAAQRPALVIVGDTALAEAERIHALCRQYEIPINVVDVPRLCSFYFPALITRGGLTVSVATGGSSPEAAAYLRKQIEDLLPEQTAQIMDWICLHRAAFRKQNILKQAIAEAFAKNRPLTESELRELSSATE